MTAILTRRPHLALAAAVLLLGGTPARAAAPDWEILDDCRIVESKSNDADSFRVRHGDKEYMFRLYFVDAAETSFEFSDRIGDQATYFGIAPERVPELGWKAVTAATGFLKPGFTVQTKWHNAQGRTTLPRFYAFVRVGGKDLAEWLVENGLARVYGTRTTTPEGLKSTDFRARLLDLEAKAKERRAGAWGMSAAGGAASNQLSVISNR
jgi:endonuclease YncB( thermonuclease family)